MFFHFNQLDVKSINFGVFTKIRKYLKRVFISLTKKKKIETHKALHIHPMYLNQTIQHGFVLIPVQPIHCPKTTLLQHFLWLNCTQSHGFAGWSPWTRSSQFEPGHDARHIGFILTCFYHDARHIWHDARYIFHDYDMAFLPLTCLQA